MKKLSDYKALNFSTDQVRDYEKIKPVLKLINDHRYDQMRSQIIDEILVALSPQFNELQWDRISEALLEAHLYVEITGGKNANK